MAQVIKLVENDQLTVTLYDDGSADWREKSTGRSIHMARYALQDDGPIDIGHVWLRTERSMCETWPAHLQAKAEGSGLRVTVLDRVHQPAGTFHVDVRLDGPWVEFAISDISSTLKSLVYPPPLEAKQLVIPSRVGRLISKPVKSRTFWMFWSHLNMRFFGGLSAGGDQGWIAIYDGGHQDAGLMLTELAAAPAWMQSLGAWPQGPRRMRYRFTTGGYVGIAKTFRAYAKDHGLFKSLQEKIAENPQVDNLVGGRLLGFMQARSRHPERYEERFQTAPESQRKGDGQKVEVALNYADVRRIIDHAFELGMTKGVAILRGWINGGYDESHPDIWPPEPALGTIDELRALCQQSRPGRLTVGLHDNYQDIYKQSKSFPQGVNVMPDGKLMAGGLWFGGQAFILSSQASIDYLTRNWAEIATLHPGAMFIDTTTAVQLMQSYEKGHTQTRAQDEARKTELLMFLRRQKVMVGSEESADFGIPLCDWMENRHARVPGESIPLWPLVYHDAILCGRYLGQVREAQAPAPRWLTDMLWGYFVLLGDTIEQDNVTGSATFQASLECDRWHARIGTAEMTNHRYLTPDGLVEQTEFAPGMTITCNFGEELARADGVEIPPGGHVIQ